MNLEDICVFSLASLEALSAGPFELWQSRAEGKIAG